MTEGDEELLPLGCLAPRSLSLLAKVALLAFFFYALGSMLGLWSE